MKILFCTNAFEVVSNGPAKFAHLLLNINAIPGHELRILTEDITIADEKSVYKQTLHIPRIFQKLGMFIRMFQYHRRAMQIKRDGFDFDYLVYNNAIVAIWSSLRFKNTIGFINDDTTASVSWKQGFSKFKWSRLHIFFLAEYFACLFCKKIVVNSAYLLNLLTKRYHVRKSKIHCLYKSIAAVPAFEKIPNPVPEILFVKNDYLRGGLITLINALKASDHKIKLIIAGIAVSEIPKIESILKNASFEYEIRGIIKQEEVFRLMQHADIFCVPSFKEALGVANMEAMAYGCSVISTNIGGIPEVLDYGTCGWLVEPGNINQLQHSISECLNNPEIRLQKQKNAYAKAEHFVLDDMLEKFLKIIGGNG